MRRLRRKNKISLRKFAKMVGLSPIDLSMVERDKFNPPNEEKIKTISEALGEDAGRLLELARIKSDKRTQQCSREGISPTDGSVAGTAS